MIEISMPELQQVFGESSKSQAEQGRLYLLELRPHFQWKIAAYADFLTIIVEIKVDGITADQNMG